MRSLKFYLASLQLQHIDFAPIFYFNCEHFLFADFIEKVRRFIKTNENRI